MTRPSVLGPPTSHHPSVVTIPGTDLVTTTLGFGCAGLYAEPRRGERRRLLDAAYAAGIRHFDVAPMYGLGVAERALGRFAGGKRDEVVIATKFGIKPWLAAWPLARVQGPLRRLLRTFPALRRQARSSAAGPGSGRAGSLLYRGTGFDAASARASLERSLRELRTGHIDLFLLHDPEPGSVRSDDLCGYLEDARQTGAIRAWGLAGEPEPTLEVARAFPVHAPVLQLRDDILVAPAANFAAPDVQGRITFGVLGRSIGAVVSHVGEDPGRRRLWHDAVGADCADPEVTAGLLLRLAARENRAGVVLFSTTRIDHVFSAAAAMSLSPDGAQDLCAFVRLVDTELRGHQRSPGAES